MLEKLVDFSVRNRGLMLALWGMIGLGGWWALGKLSIDAVPDTSNVQVSVLTTAPGLSGPSVSVCPNAVVAVIKASPATAAALIRAAVLRPPVAHAW